MYKSRVALFLTMTECWRWLVLSSRRLVLFVIAYPPRRKSAIFESDRHPEPRRGETQSFFPQIGLPRLCTIRLKEAELPRLMGLCIPETRNLRFRSWSIPERDNSSKGTVPKTRGKASISQPARRNFPCEKEIPVLKKEFHFAKKMFTLWKNF